jgi:hypothetical protein
MEYGYVYGETNSTAGLAGWPPNWQIITGSDSGYNKKRIDKTLNYFTGTGTYISTEYIEAQYIFKYQGTQKSSSKRWE